MVCKLDEQNRILFHDSHQQENADEAVNIQGSIRQPHRPERAGQTEWKREEDNHRVEEAIELGSEYHISDEDPEHEGEEERVNRFFEGLRGARDGNVIPVWERFGGLDFALIAYGSLPDQARCEQDAEAATAAMTLNFISPALLAGALANRFTAQGHGVIAVISSVAGDRGRRSNYVYGAAKGGLQRYLEGLRHRLAATGVAVLDIRPGFVSTKMTAHLNGSGPLWATPDAVAGDIVGAIKARRAVLYTPWFWRLIMLLIRALPRAIMHRTSI